MCTPLCSYIIRVSNFLYNKNQKSFRKEPNSCQAQSNECQCNEKCRSQARSKQVTLIFLKFHWNWIFTALTKHTIELGRFQFSKISHPLVKKIQFELSKSIYLVKIYPFENAFPTLKKPVEVLNWKEMISDFRTLLWIVFARFQKFSSFLKSSLGTLSKVSGWVS